MEFHFIHNLGSTSSSSTSNPCDQCFIIFRSYYDDATTIHAQRSLQIGKKKITILIFIIFFFLVSCFVSISEIQSHIWNTNVSTTKYIFNKNKLHILPILLNVKTGFWSYFDSPNQVHNNQ